MSNISRYDGFYNLISNKPCTDEKLRLMKEAYSDVINSKRRLENIASLRELLQILQKRDYINTDKINTLLEIGRTWFEDFPVGLPIINQQNNVAINRLNNVTNNEGPILRPLPIDLKERVYQVIASDIGQKWTDFARVLHVPEGSIDNLYALRDIKNRVYQILRFYEDRCDPRLWRSGLLDALSDARRNDLRKKVQNIFDTYGTYAAI